MDPASFHCLALGDNPFWVENIGYGMERRRTKKEMKEGRLLDEGEFCFL